MEQNGKTITKRERKVSEVKCFFCKGNMSSGFTTHVVNVNNSVIVIKNVPCEKCDQCGETIYTGTIVMQLESIVRQLKISMAEVVVVNFNDKVA